MLKINITRLLQHSALSNFLSREQFGFKSNSSSDKVIFILLNEILNALIINLQCGIFCHLEKACDCIDHNILPSRLQYYGITGLLCTLIQSYLAGRYQCVVRNSKISNHMF